MWPFLIIGLTLAIFIILYFSNNRYHVFHRKTKSDRERIQNEDALKKLYDHEYVGEPASLNSLAGAMELPLNKTASILHNLVSLGLVQSDSAPASGSNNNSPKNHTWEKPYRPLYYKLTKDGRQYALRIIRTHRLWERYFSDRTGLARDKWHREAEIREHHTTPEEAEQLALSMGNPSYDPDGDPIPTAKGEIPPLLGVPLSALKSGENARIKHIEDEPQNIYSKLIRAGLYPGMELHVEENTREGIRIHIRDRIIKLDKLSAANLTVIRTNETDRSITKIKTLADLDLGEIAEISAISPACHGAQRRRLLDLGLLPGTRVSAELTSFSGNPTAYNIRGATIALRKEQAQLIQIKTKESTNVQHV